MSLVEERRCPHCRALVSPDADWCGQCFTALRPNAEGAPGPDRAAHTEPVAAAPGLGTVEEDSPDGPRALATWSCPTCEQRNPIDRDACEVCGTAFATLFRQDERPPEVDPQTALLRSLLFPGLGHRALGRGLDGVARGVLFLWTFGTTILILLSGPTGPVVGLLSMYGLLALVIYLVTALEAYRMAQGGGPIVSSRVLLWGAVSLVLVSVLMATFIIFAAARS